MPNIKLTDMFLRSVKSPENGQVTYWDTTIPSFGLRVGAGGTKTWTIMRGLERRRLSIGRYPVISLSTAREQAKKLLAEITLGKDFRATITFDVLVSRFIEASRARNKAGTTAEYQRLMAKHFLPALGRHKVGELHARDVSDILSRMSDTPSEANHSLTAIKAVLNFAVQHHYIANNPCLSMPLPSRRFSRERVLHGDELAKVFHAATLIGYPFGAIVKLCLLTGQRRGEISHLRWEYINETDRMIILPAAIVKNNREHAFPYGEMSAMIFAGLPHRKGYLFPASKAPGTVFNGWGKQKNQLDAAASLPHWTLHDLRRSFATHLAGLGVAPHIIERLINHASGTISGVSAIYNRYTYLPDMRAALDKYDNHLSDLFNSVLSAH